MKTQQQSSEQNGFVSIIVTMIVMIVLTLTVLGFAQLARREQRQSLDRQLSTQALFAAESGVNEAVNRVKNGFTGEINTCGPLPPGFNNPQLSPTVSYSCLLLKQKQDTLQYDSISTDNSTYIPIDSDTDITSITIGWGKTASTSLGNNPVNPATKFPPISNWPITGLGVLRFDITAADPAGPFGNELQPSRLEGANKSFFLYPSSGGTSSFPLFAFSTTTGSIFSGNCGPPSATTSQPCNVTINSVGAIGARRKFFLRLKSIYQPSSVTICVNTCGGGGSTALLSGAQLSIDVTGKAQDQVKRINVRLPAPVNIPSGSLPEFTLDSMKNICKTLTIMPNPAPLSGNSNTSSRGTCNIN